MSDEDEEFNIHIPGPLGVLLLVFVVFSTLHTLVEIVVFIAMKVKP